MITQGHTHSLCNDVCSNYRGREFFAPDSHTNDMPTHETLHYLELVFYGHFTKLGDNVISTMIQALIEASEVIYVDFTTRSISL